MAMDGRWPEDPRFPAIRRSELSSKGLGRELGKWGSFGCEWFEEGGAEARDLAGGTRAARARSRSARGRRKGEEGEGAGQDKAVGGTWRGDDGVDVGDGQCVAPHAREAMEGERGAAASSSVRRVACAALWRCCGQFGFGDPGQNIGALQSWYQSQNISFPGLVHSGALEPNKPKTRMESFHSTIYLQPNGP